MNEFAEAVKIVASCPQVDSTNEVSALAPICILLYC